MEERINVKKVLVINGPNLNLLGTREPEIYGKTTLDEIDTGLKEQGRKIGIDVETFQSNHEGAIVDKIQQAIAVHDGLIINPAAYTHSSIAIRDALAVLDIPIVEVHISNIHRREPFRHHSVVSGVVTAQIKGFGAQGYYMALKAMADMIG